MADNRNLIIGLLVVIVILLAVLAFRYLMYGPANIPDGYQPQPLRTGPGMMYGPGYGYNYSSGPGMMYGPGYGYNYSLGPGMMYGPGYGYNYR